MPNEILWTAEEVGAALGVLPDAPWRTTGVSIDSRTCKAGDLFIAIEGPNFDGHDFVREALENGALAAIVARDPKAVTAGASVLRVDDTMDALEGLGRAARDRSTAKIIAITGSVGKTGAKQALARVLGDQAPVHASEKSFNNRWGVPLSLARMPRSATYGVFELGMNQAGEIAALVDQVRPHLALITAIEAAHSEFFESVDDIAEAKAEIFQGLESGGTAILNRDSVFYERLAKTARAAGAGVCLGFGMDERAEARVLDHVLHADCSCIDANICGNDITYKIGIPGQHWVANSLAVLMTASAAGADLGLGGLSLAKLTPLAGRGRRTEIETRDGPFLVIDESYNANPASMAAALSVLALNQPGAGGRRIAVLGDMLELGADSKALHAALAGPLTACGADLVFTAGAAMAGLAGELESRQRAGHAENSGDLAALVTRAVRPGDVVMVKGSFASGMGAVVEELKLLTDHGMATAVNA